MRVLPRGRAIAVFALLVVYIVGASIAGLRWQTPESQARLLPAIAAREPQQKTVRALRGVITDRNGKILAISIKRERVVRDRVFSEGTAKAALALIVRELALDATAQERLAARLADTARAYVPLTGLLDRERSDRVAAAIAKSGIGGLRMEEHWTRSYPQPAPVSDVSLAAPLLGYVDADGVGHYGIEEQYDRALRGTDATVSFERSATGDAVPGTERVLDEGAEGQDVQLTIDADLQLLVERELNAAAVADEAESASALVMDPATGEIYAAASWPSYNANDLTASAKLGMDRFRDQNGIPYDPGSMMKIAVAAAALEDGIVTRDTKVKDAYSLAGGGGTTIRNSDRKSLGVIPYKYAIARSRNVANATVALKLGKTQDAASKRLYRSWVSLGFDRPAGGDMPESAGYARDPAKSKWQRIDLLNASFGQGISLAPLSLAGGFASLMNGGRLITPHVGARVGETPLSFADRGRSVSPETSTTVTRLLRDVLEMVPWYGERSLQPGYLVGGKTGTAQIWDTKKHEYRTDAVNSSFVGFFGRGRPELLVMVSIRGNKSYGGWPPHSAVESFELFGRIARNIELLYGWTPTIDEKGKPYDQTKDDPDTMSPVAVAGSVPTTPGMAPLVIPLVVAPVSVSDTTGEASVGTSVAIP